MKIVKITRDTLTLTYGILVTGSIDFQVLIGSSSSVARLYTCRCIMRQVRLHDRDLVQSSRRIRHPLLVFIQDELNEELNDVLKLIVQGCPDEV